MMVWHVFGYFQTITHITHTHISYIYNNALQYVTTFLCIMTSHSGNQRLGGHHVSDALNSPLLRSSFLAGTCPHCIPALRTYFLPDVVLMFNSPIVDDGPLLVQMPILWKGHQTEIYHVPKKTMTIQFSISCRLARAILPWSAGGTSSCRIFGTPTILTVHKLWFPGRRIKSGVCD